ncbi:MAG: hypothetical protein ACXQTS_05345, partial [Candidatus Methanospirareceae archaeon]
VEICKATGWDRDDMVEEIKNIDKKPSDRKGIYSKLFFKYLRQASLLKIPGDMRERPQRGACKKLWGAITALIKWYGSEKGVFVIHWDKRELNEFVDAHIGDDFRDKFFDLLTYGGELYFHYEELPKTRIDKHWERCMKIMEEILKERYKLQLFKLVFKD